LYIAIVVIKTWLTVNYTKIYGNKNDQNVKKLQRLSHEIF